MSTLSVLIIALIFVAVVYVIGYMMRVELDKTDEWWEPSPAAKQAQEDAAKLLRSINK